MVALCIMLTDVPINWYANDNYWMLPLHKNPSLMMQAAFLVFLLPKLSDFWGSDVLRSCPSDDHHR
jgi:hypothetical protein